VAKSVGKRSLSVGRRMGIYQLLSDYSRVQDGSSSSLVWMFRKIAKRKAEHKESDAWFYLSVIEHVERDNMNIIEAMATILPSDEMMIIRTTPADKISTGLMQAMKKAKRKNEIKNTLTSVMGYPIFSFTFSIVLLVFLLSGTHRPFTLMLDVDSWPSSAMPMHYMYMVLVDKWYITVAAVVGLLLYIMVTLKLARGGVRVVLDYLPPWNMQKKMQGAAFVESLGQQLAAEVSVPMALERIEPLADRYLKSYVRTMRERLAKNMSVDDVLDVGLLDRDTMGKIRDFSQQNNFAAILQNIGDQAMDRVLVFIRVIGMSLGILLIIGGTISNAYVNYSGQILTKVIQSEYKARARR